MSDNRRMGNKLRLMNQLIELNSVEQVELLMSVLKVLSDNSQDSMWCNLDARRMILGFLMIHHPYNDASSEQDKWDNDRRDATRRRNSEVKALEKSGREE